MKAIVSDKLAPRLGDRALAKNGFEAQMTKERTRKDQPDDLFAPVPGDQGAHGSFDEQARSRSAAWWVSKHRGLLAGVALTLATTTAVARYLRWWARHCVQRLVENSSCSRRSVTARAASSSFSLDGGAEVIVGGLGGAEGATVGAGVADAAAMGVRARSTAARVVGRAPTCQVGVVGASVGAGAIETRASGRISVSPPHAAGTAEVALAGVVGTAAVVAVRVFDVFETRTPRSAAETTARSIVATIHPLERWVGAASGAGTGALCQTPDDETAPEKVDHVAGGG
jgi:hypothetical protein